MYALGILIYIRQWRNMCHFVGIYELKSLVSSCRRIFLSHTSVSRRTLSTPCVSEKFIFILIRTIYLRLWLSRYGMMLLAAWHINKTTCLYTSLYDGMTMTPTSNEIPLNICLRYVWGRVFYSNVVLCLNIIDFYLRNANEL